jgi:uncharacterized protein with GYD domain
MPKYLIEASYTLEGSRGIMKSGGTARREAVRQAVESVGGRFEVQYFALGEYDAFVIADLPDHVSAAAISLAVTATGSARTKTTALLTPEEVDQAVEKRSSTSHLAHRLIPGCGPWCPHRGRSRSAGPTRRVTAYPLANGRWSTRRYVRITTSSPQEGRFGASWFS